MKYESKSAAKTAARRVLVALRQLLAAFPSYDMADATIGAYAMNLADLPIGILEAAITEVIQTEKRFPQIATIRAIAERLIDENSGVSMAEEAWNTALEFITAGGPRDGETCPELIWSVVKVLGGWEEMGRQPTADRVWRRKDFIRIYQAMQRRQHRPALGPVVRPRITGVRNEAMERIDVKGWLKLNGLEQPGKETT